MKTLSDPEYRALTRRLLIDLVLDTGGNLALGLGLYLVFSRPEPHLPVWLQSPEVLAILLATGLINLRLIPARLRRLRLWQTERLSRRDR